MRGPRWRVLVALALAAAQVLAVAALAPLLHDAYTHDASVVTFWVADAVYGSSPDNPMIRCGDRAVCVIRQNRGGLSMAFLAAARELHAAPGRWVVIDGPCYSGCASFAAYGRPQVCVTRRALLGFHKSNMGDDQSLPRDVRAWVLAHGGFPDHDGGETTDITWPETELFWPTCEVD